MADTYTGKKITEITENTSGDDTDLLVVGNRGTAVMRRFTLANLATYIRDKLASLTFSALNTSSKTLPGAINELNNNLTVEKSSVYTASNSYCSVEYSYVQCGKIVILSVYFTPKTTVTMDTGSITLASLPGTPHNTIVSATICVTQSVSTPLGSAYLSPSKFMVAFGPRTSGQSYRATFAYMV